MIEVLDQSDRQTLADLKREYLASQAAPVDGMWEAFGDLARHREVLSEGERAGYFCVSEEGQLLRFFVAPRFESLTPEIFAATVAREEVRGAMVSTADPLFLSCCLDLQSEIDVHTYLYQDRRPAQTRFAAEVEASLSLVEAQELDAIAALQRESLEQDPGDWLVGYLRNLIARGELYALRQDGEIVGTGETRISDSQPPYADLGVITISGHRRRGVASDILRRLKQLCYDRGLTPICSTTLDNVAAQRAIAAAGFVSRHRLLRVVF